MGIELPNGQKLDANKSGHIVTDDPRVEKLAKKSTVGQMGALGTRTYNFSNVNQESRICRSCSFVGWVWQTQCPKCHDEMTTPTTEVEDQ